MPQVPTITLNDGHTIPQVGFGVFQVPTERTEAAVATALETGYRHIDTAALYGNEVEVGAAVRASGVPREEVYVTTKLANSDHGYDSALAAFDASLARLDLDYIDLYLIHWPRPRADRYVETWRAFEKLLAGGQVRSIGVSNFQISHLQRLFAETGTVPALNQIELHPWLQQSELRAFHAEQGIATEAWSPIARGGDLLRDPTVGEIAQRLGKTPAQVVLRWHVQLGNVVIPRSVTPSRIRENLDLFDVELTDDDLAAIASLDRGQRIGPNPDTLS